MDRIEIEKGKEEERNMGRRGRKEKDDYKER